MSPNPVNIHPNYPHKQRDSYNFGVFDRGGRCDCRRVKLSRWSEHGVTAGLFKLGFIRCLQPGYQLTWIPIFGKVSLDREILLKLGEI
ncbi:hypothetical protein AOLI_G00193050 [Acnodon oligacanthus]